MSDERRYATLNINGQACQIRGYCPWHPERKRVENFVAARFLAAHGAHLQHYMPLLLALETEEGELLALAGIRCAEREALFLEHYLTAPIERVITRSAGLEIPRSQIVEIGHLTAVKPGYGRYLFVALTDVLTAWHFEWMACTGIADVRNIFRRLGMSPEVVAPALPEKIPGGGEGWGDYYRKHPQVMIGRIAMGHAQALRSGILAELGYAREEARHVLIA